MIPVPNMIRFFCLLAYPMAAMAAPSGFGSYQDVRTTAKTGGADFVVFYAGPDWRQETTEVIHGLNAPGGRGALSRLTGWASLTAIDLTEENLKKFPERPDFSPYDLPALALADAAGRTFAVAEGLTATNLPQALGALAAAIPARERRDALFEKAKTAHGIDRAKLYGQGMDQLPIRFSAGRKDLLNEIKKADPDDASGYTFKYTFSAGGFHESVTGKMIAEKKQAELLTLVDRHLRNPVLQPSQRQALLAAKMQAYRSLNDVPMAVSTLREIIRIDPRSEHGTGAVQYIRLLTEPVRLTGLAWASGDNRPTWLPMVADVTTKMAEPGTYRIEFRHRDGHTRFRKATLKSGGRQIAADSTPNESTKFTLSVPQAAKGRSIELWVESQGTGWFAGRGEILVTKEK